MTTIQGKTLLELGQDVARYLPGEWSVSWPGGEPSWCVNLTRPDGACVHLGHRDYAGNRFDASGRFPSGYEPREDRVSISMADTKSPEHIARDIDRRLLPTYLSQYATAVAGKARDDHWAHEARRVADRLETLIGDKASANNGRGWRLRRWGREDNYSIEAEIDQYSKARRVKLILDDLTLEETETILSALKVTP